MDLLRSGRVDLRGVLVTTLQCTDNIYTLYFFSKLLDEQYIHTLQHGSLDSIKVRQHDGQPKHGVAQTMQGTHRSDVRKMLWTRKRCLITAQTFHLDGKLEKDTYYR